MELDFAPIGMEAICLLGATAGLLTSAIASGDVDELERIAQGIIDGISDFAQTVPDGDTDIPNEVMAIAHQKSMIFARKVKYDA